MTAQQEVNELDAYFEPETEDEVVEVEAETEVEAEPSEPESEEESKGEEEQTAPPAEEEELTVEEAIKQRDAFKAMALDEKKKRQEEQRLNTSRAMPDPETQPEEFAKFMVESRITQSRDLVMSLDGFDDFEDVESHFLKMVEFNPNLAVQMNQDRNPALFAYKTAKEDMEFQKLKDPEYQKQREKEIEEKIRAELMAQMQVPEKKATQTVPDLTKAASTGGTSEKIPLSEDLDTYLGDRPY